MLPDDTPKSNLRRVHAVWRVARHMALAVSLFTSGAAEAWTLDALLQLPLERLLELSVTVQDTPAPGPLICAPPTGTGATQGEGRAA